MRPLERILLAPTRRPGGNPSATAEGSDLFEAFRALRRRLDPMGIRILLAGARRDAWRSPTSRLVSLPRAGTPADEAETVWMFEAAPAETIGSVDEQDHAYEVWRTSAGTA